MTYQCDSCGRMASRIHHLWAYGGDVDCCDDCCGYEWEAYGEDHDPVLHPELAAERERILQDMIAEEGSDRVRITFENVTLGAAA